MLSAARAAFAALAAMWASWFPPAPSPANPAPHPMAAVGWARLRDCENSGRYTSRPGDRYRGAYQFDRGTWASVGGTGDPASAPPGEQDARALRLYASRGRQPWPVCGRFLP